MFFSSYVLEASIRIHSVFRMPMRANHSLYYIIAGWTRKLSSISFNKSILPCNRNLVYKMHNFEYTSALKYSRQFNHVCALVQPLLLASSLFTVFSFPFKSLCACSIRPYIFSTIVLLLTEEQNCLPQCLGYHDYISFILRVVVAGHISTIIKSSRRLFA